MKGHTFLVAFVVEHDGTREEAEHLLTMALPRPQGLGRDDMPGNDWLDCWWVAEDDRHDRSDCDSAVFVPMGTQDEIRQHLRDRVDHFLY